MGMCRWMGSHFHNWVDCNGVAFPTEFLIDILEWGRKFVGIFGVRKFWLVGFKNGKICGKKSCYRKSCSVVDLIFTSCITFCFETTIKGRNIRFMHNQKVTKLGSLKLHLPKSD